MHDKLCHSDELPSGPLLAAPGQPDPIRTNQGYSAEGPFQRFDPFDPHEVAKIFQAGSVPHVDHTSAPDLNWEVACVKPCSNQILRQSFVACCFPLEGCFEVVRRVPGDSQLHQDHLGWGLGPVDHHQVRLLLRERHVGRDCAPVDPPPIKVGKNCNALLPPLDDGVDEVAEDRIVTEGEPVKRFGAAAEEMSEGAYGVAPLHGAGLVDL